MGRPCQAQARPGQQQHSGPRTMKPAQPMATAAVKLAFCGDFYHKMVEFHGNTSPKMLLFCSNSYHRMIVIYGNTSHKILYFMVIRTINYYHFVVTCTRK